MAATTTTLALLAPSPDFRYVGLEAGPRVQRGYLGGLAGAAALGVAAMAGVGARPLLLTAAGALAASLVLARGGGPHSTHGLFAHGVPMAIVPWGIVVDPAARSRVLRWAGVERVVARMFYGTDTGTPTTRWSVVTVETPRERLSGRAPGAVPLERLVVHMEAYARESSHVLALDLDGDIPGEGPCEPELEPILAAVRAYLHGPPASNRLDLPVGGYRDASPRAPSDVCVATLRSVLRDRTARSVDPRAFACVLAAELDAKELVADLVALVQCPHPLIAAVAKAAAQRLGAGGVTGGSTRSRRSCERKILPRSRSLARRAATRSRSESSVIRDGSVW